MGTGGKGGGGARPLTQEERDLFAQQTKSLKRADEIATQQFGLSKQDRAYFGKIYRGEADPNDPAVKAKIDIALQKAKTNNPDITKEGRASIVNNVLEGLKDKSKSVDSILFKAVKNSKDELGVALTDFADKTAVINKKYGEFSTGISSKYTKGMNDLAASYGSKLDSIVSEYKRNAGAANAKYGNYIKTALNRFDDTTGKYQTAFEQVSKKASANLGKADSDILSRQRGQELAGISQAYNEAQNKLLSALGRRGLAGSGVEASSLTKLNQSEAQQKAGAFTNSYNKAITLSDTRRLQQVGLQQNVSQQGIGIASQLLANQQQYGSTQLQGELSAAQGAAQYGMQGAQGAYMASANAAKAGYQAGMTNITQQRQLAQQLAGLTYQGTTGNIQQNIANMQLASGVSQGVYGGASNMLAGAGQTSNQSAQIAGSTANGIGSNDVAYRNAQMNERGGMIGSLFGAGATLGAAYLG